jgi:hypothetical protein
MLVIGFFALWRYKLLWHELGKRHLPIDLISLQVDRMMHLLSGRMWVWHRESIWGFCIVSQGSKAVTVVTKALYSQLLHQV